MPAKKKALNFEQLLSMLFRAHPFHGMSPGDRLPEFVDCYIEMPEDSPVKLELDKISGHLRIDRPHLYSSLCPIAYGFIPRTYCGKLVGELCSSRTGLVNVYGDGDPLDICVLTDRNLPQCDMVLPVRPIGGFRMVDHGKADDKIIAVLENDLTYGDYTDISQVPKKLLEKLRHYFLSYKRPPGAATSVEVQIPEDYGRDGAIEVINASLADYDDEYGSPKDRLMQLKNLLSVELKKPTKRKPRKRA